MNKEKKAFSAGAIIGYFLGGVALVYAITQLFAIGDPHTIRVGKGDKFGIIDMHPYPQEEGSIVKLLPGEGIDVNPTITSDAVADMYVFVKIEMPATIASGGLYSVELNTGWERVANAADPDDGLRWIEVYGYSSPLLPGEECKLTDRVVMKNIEISEYVDIDDLNMTWTAYACGAENTEFESAWVMIEGHEW